MGGLVILALILVAIFIRRRRAHRKFISFQKNTTVDILFQVVVISNRLCL
jgi:flagellar biogenesis protein FliO